MLCSLCPPGGGVRRDCQPLSLGQAITVRGFYQPSSPSRQNPKHSSGLPRGGSDSLRRTTGFAPRSQNDRFFIFLSPQPRHRFFPHLVGVLGKTDAVDAIIPLLLLPPPLGLSKSVLCLWGHSLASRVWVRHVGNLLRTSMVFPGIAKVKRILGHPWHCCISVYSGQCHEYLLVTMEVYQEEGDYVR